MAKDREMTVREAARTVGCTEETIRRAIRRKELLAHRDPVSRGSRFLIYASDLVAFLERRRSR